MSGNHKELKELLREDGSIVKDVHPDFMMSSNNTNVAIDNDYRIHGNWLGSWMHQTGEFLFYPLRWALWAFGTAVQPAAGEGKDNETLSKTDRGLAITGLVLTVITVFPLAIILASSLLGGFFRGLGHLNRAKARLIVPDDYDPRAEKTRESSVDDALDKAKDLKVWSYNVALVPKFMSISTDVRHPEDRAAEIAHQILSKDDGPDVIAFQEVFNEDASEIMLTRLRKKYPFVLHSVMPSMSGFNSGQVIVSKYPIKNVEFYRYDDLTPPLNLANRGILSAEVDSPKGPVRIYNFHTQPLRGAKQAEIRLNELKKLRRIMQQDEDKYPDCEQMVVGDLNSSEIGAHGEDNVAIGQPEKEVWDYIRSEFNVAGEQDELLKVRNKITGLYTKYLVEKGKEAHTGQTISKEEHLEFCKWLLDKQKKKLDAIHKSQPSRTDQKDLIFFEYFEKIFCNNRIVDVNKTITLVKDNSNKDIDTSFEGLIHDLMNRGDTQGITFKERYLLALANDEFDKPVGSWVHGPFIEKPASIVSAEKSKNSKGKSAPDDTMLVGLDKSSRWGRSTYATLLGRALFDHGLTRNDSKICLKSKVIEPYQPENKTSACSDHAPVEYDVFYKEDQHSQDPSLNSTPSSSSSNSTESSISSSSPLSQADQTSLTLDERGKKLLRGNLEAQQEKIAFLAFSGGGPKGGAYPGVVAALEHNQKMNDVIGVGGSSAGAITAAYIATGGTSESLKEFTAGLDLKSLLGNHVRSSVGIPHPTMCDGKPLLEKIQEVVLKNTIATIYTILPHDMYVTDNDACPFKFANKVSNAESHLIQQCKYLLTKREQELKAKGKKDPAYIAFKKEFYNDEQDQWQVDNLVEVIRDIRMMDNKNVTFKQLHVLALASNKFKELHVTAATKDAEFVHFSHEGALADVSIADACRASAALPSKIAPHPITVKKGNESLTMEMIDGGTMSNIPTRLFKHRSEGRTVALGFNQLGRIHRAIHGIPDGEVVPPNLLTKVVDFVTRRSFDDPDFSFRQSIEQNMQQLSRVSHSVINIETSPVETLDFKRATKLRRFLEITGEVQTLGYLYNQGVLSEFKQRRELPGNATSVANQKEINPQYDKFLLQQLLKDMCATYLHKAYIKPPGSPVCFTLPILDFESLFVTKLNETLTDLEESLINPDVTAADLMTTISRCDNDKKKILLELLNSNDCPVRLKHLVTTAAKNESFPPVYQQVITQYAKYEAGKLVQKEQRDLKFQEDVSRREFTLDDLEKVGLVDDNSKPDEGRRIGYTY